MKSKSFYNFIWVVLVLFSVACYGYLFTREVPELSAEVSATTTLEENEEEARVYLADIALLKKFYELAKGYLNR